MLLQCPSHSCGWLWLCGVARGAGRVALGAAASPSEVLLAAMALAALEATHPEPSLPGQPVGHAGTTGEEGDMLGVSLA